jgi:hypothetical protein
MDAVAYDANLSARALERLFSGNQCPDRRPRRDTAEHFACQIEALADLRVRPRSELINEHGKAVPCTRGRRPSNGFRSNSCTDVSNLLASLHIVAQQVSPCEPPRFKLPWRREINDFVKK